MVAAFDEMKGHNGGVRPAYSETVALARRGAARCAGLSAARGRADLPAHWHHVRSLRRSRRAGTPDPVRRHPAHYRRAPNGGSWKRASPNASMRSTPSSKTSTARAKFSVPACVPDDLVFRNPAFRPEMSGQKVPHDIYVHVAGIDIVRVDAETFYVLEDNARTPSGVSYMLENREIMMRLFPELFSRHRVAPVENYPDELLATLTSVAPRRPRANRTSCCSRPACSIPPITSTRSSPISSVSSWSKAAIFSSRTRSSICAPRRGRAAST